MVKLQIDPTNAIILKRKWYQDLKNNVPKSVTCKYTIQIHKYKYKNTVWVKSADTPYYIFEKVMV